MVLNVLKIQLGTAPVTVLEHKTMKLVCLSKYVAFIFILFPKFIHNHQCSYSYTNVNVTVHIKSAINVHTVVANINVTVHIK